MSIVKRLHETPEARGKKYNIHRAPDYTITAYPDMKKELPTADTKIPMPENPFPSTHPAFKFHEWSIARTHYEVLSENPYQEKSVLSIAEDGTVLASRKPTARDLERKVGWRYIVDRQPTPAPVRRRRPIPQPEQVEIPLKYAAVRRRTPRTPLIP